MASTALPALPADSFGSPRDHNRRSYGELLNWGRPVVRKPGSLGHLSRVRKDNLVCEVGAKVLSPKALLSSNKMTLSEKSSSKWTAPREISREHLQKFIELEKDLDSIGTAGELLRGLNEHWMLDRMLPAEGNGNKSKNPVPGLKLPSLEQASEIGRTNGAHSLPASSKLLGSSRTVPFHPQEPTVRTSVCERGSPKHLRISGANLGSGSKLPEEVKSVSASVKKKASKEKEVSEQLSVSMQHELLVRSHSWYVPSDFSIRKNLGGSQTERLHLEGSASRKVYGHNGSFRGDKLNTHRFHRGQGTKSHAREEQSHLNGQGQTSSSFHWLQSSEDGLKRHRPSKGVSLHAKAESETASSFSHSQHASHGVGPWGTEPEQEYFSPRDRAGHIPAKDRHTYNNQQRPSCTQSSSSMNSQGYSSSSDASFTSSGNGLLFECDNEWSASHRPRNHNASNRNSSNQSSKRLDGSGRVPPLPLPLMLNPVRMLPPSEQKPTNQHQYIQQLSDSEILSFAADQSSPPATNPIRKQTHVFVQPDERVQSSQVDELFEFLQKSGGKEEHSDDQDTAY